MNENFVPKACLVLYEGENLRNAELKERIRNAINFSDAEASLFCTKAIEALLGLRVQRSDAILAGRGEGAWEEDDSQAAPSHSKTISVVETWGKDMFRVGNLVGSAQLPGIGLQVEILPKVMDQVNDPGQHRLSLMRMWQFASDLQMRDDDSQAFMALAKLPLHEWLIQRFLQQVQALLARGLRFQYVEQERNLTTARGRLLVSANMRANPLAPHRFYCRFEEMSPNRPENRLIRSALDKVRRQTANDRSRKEAAALADWMHEVPTSRNVAHDFSSWRDDRLMAHYKEIRSTCRWILQEQASAPIGGHVAMFGRFVRMNDVFERYVARWMAERLGQAHVLVTQGSGNARARKALFEPGGLQNPMKPDMLLFEPGEQSSCLAIVDAKWKRPNAGQLASRGDLYQIYAYASHWMDTDDSERDRVVALVYPQLPHEQARQPQPFHFPRLSNVKGFALWFELPVLKGKDWFEGLVIEEEAEAPSWMLRCRVPDHAASRSSAS